MRITFILSNIPNPRNNKRIKAFAEFAEVDVICTRRLNMDVCPLDSYQNVNYHVMDIEVPTVNHLFKRALAFWRFYRFCKSILKKLEPDIIYLCGLDNLLIASASVLEKTKICYEVADLRESYTNHHNTLSMRSVFDTTVKWIEEKLSHNVSLLVVTSIKFYENHYNKLFEKEQVIEVPNMPNLAAFDHYKPKEGGEFTIGFVGGIRYVEQMKMLVDAAKEADVKVIFSGASLDKDSRLISYCTDKPWVTFTGRFDFMKDIAGIYGKIDCVYSVYDASNFNVRIALPNKLYEAVVAEIPIIVANNTYLGQLVNEWGTGICIDYNDKHALVEVLNKLKSKGDYYAQFVANCKQKKTDIDVAMYLKRLCARIQNL